LSIQASLPGCLSTINPRAESVRGRRAIEHALHWVLDIVFREGDSRIRKGHARKTCDAQTYGIESAEAKKEEPAWHEGEVTPCRLGQ